MGRSFFALIYLVAMLSGATAWAADTTSNLKDGVILEGYDPVSYFQGDKPKKGKADLKTTDEGVTYYFANAENRSEFLKSPKKYRPAYGGWCATAVVKGTKYDIDPENYKVTDGRLFLFYKGWRGDAKKEWVEDEAKHIKTADDNWPTVMNTQP